MREVGDRVRFSGNWRILGRIKGEGVIIGKSVVLDKVVYSILMDKPVGLFPQISATDEDLSDICTK